MTCTVPGCDRRHHSGGLCDAHRQQARRGVDLRPIETKPHRDGCTYPGCGRNHYALGYCSTHWDQLRDGRPLSAIRERRAPTALCEVEGCGRPHRSKGLCSAHYNQSARGTARADMGPIAKREGHPAPRPTPNRGPCAHTGCDRPARCRGWCRAHYTHVLRYGTTRDLGTRTRKAVEPRTPKPPKPPKPPKAMPAGWDKPARKPTAPPMKAVGQQLSLKPHPIDPEQAAAVRRLLARHGCEDLAEALGVAA